MKNNVKAQVRITVNMENVPEVLGRTFVTEMELLSAGIRSQIKCIAAEPEDGAALDTVGLLAADLLAMVEEYRDQLRTFINFENGDLELGEVEDTAQPAEDASKATT